MQLESPPLAWFHGKEMRPKGQVALYLFRVIWKFTQFQNCAAQIEQNETTNMITRQEKDRTRQEQNTTRINQ